MGGGSIPRSMSITADTLPGVTSKKRANFGKLYFRQAWTDFDNFGWQHQYTFKNYMHMKLSLSFHCYLLYLLLNICDGNDATPATWSSCSASLTQGISPNVLNNEAVGSMKKAVVCMREGESTSFWTYAKIKPALFTATNQQSTNENALCFASLTSQLFKSKKSKQKWRNKETWICI